MNILKKIIVEENHIEKISREEEIINGKKIGHLQAKLISDHIFNAYDDEETIVGDFEENSLNFEEEIVDEITFTNCLMKVLNDFEQGIDKKSWVCDKVH